jgi:hypothetical protein
VTPPENSEFVEKVKYQENSDTGMKTAENLIVGRKLWY